MTAYALRRLVQMFAVVLVGSFALFSVIHLTPGDPVRTLLGENAPPEAVEAETQRLGLDKPIAVQYVRWVGSALSGDLGTSIINHRPVDELVRNRILPTVQLAVYAVVMGLLLAIPLALIGALKAGSVLDRLGNMYAALGLSVPTFWLGLVFIVVFSVNLGWFPATARAVMIWDSPGTMLYNLFLPALTLALLISGIFSRFLRASLAAELQEDYVRTAKAKGLSRARVVLGHATRNALLPFVTVVGLSVGALLTGAVVTESIYNYPGLGRLMIEAVQTRDYPVIQGTGLWIMLLYSLVNLGVDLLYTYIDPRVTLR